MIEILVILIFLFFSAVGAGYVTYRLWLFLIRPKSRNKTLLITKLDKENEKEQFMYCFEKYRWCGNDYADSLIMVCDGEPHKICQAFDKCYKNIVCCQEKELPLIIKYAMEEQSV